MADDERRGEVNSPEQPQSFSRNNNRRAMSYKRMKKLCTKIFSNVGLAAVVVAYTIMGGFIFRFLEAPNESKEKLRIVELKTNMVTELHQLASHLCLKTIDKANFTDTVFERLLVFQQQVNNLS
jgi:hypothetical protein